MENNYNSNIIGKGVTFPIQLTLNENGEMGWYPVNGDLKLVRDNISSILTYMIGERFRQEDFGSKLWQCIEEPNTGALVFLIKEFLIQALGTWEQRVTLQNIQVSRESSKINILITYKIIGINTSQYIDIAYNHLDNIINI